MFDELPDQWLPAAFSSKLGAKVPIAVTVDGAPLALFRDREGRPQALIDACPHRSVKLSLGTVENGCLRCPFHGWEFGAGGACERVPLNPEARRELLGAAALPTVERGGIVWIFTRIGAEAPALPELPDSLEDKALARRELEDPWAAHWTRAMENMLDVPHLPFVHRGTIGREMAARRDLYDVPLTFDLQDAPYGFRLGWAMGGKPEAGHLEWRRPVGMVLYIASPVGEMRQHIFCVPSTPGHTNMMLVSTAQRPWWTALIPGFVFNGFEDRILGEDRAIVQSSAPGSVIHAGHEKSIATDKPTLRFRAWLKSQRRGPPPESAS